MMMTTLPTYTLICVPPSMLMDVFPFVEPMIDAGYEASDEATPLDLLDWLEKQKGLLWVVSKDHEPVAAMTTSLVESRYGRALRLVACGGDDMTEWVGLMAEIEKYARAEGCVKIVAEGRRGWVRALDGFSADRVIFEKRL
jgi:hypothetical protein